MEKLIELLNEYEKSSFEKDTNWVYEWEEWEYYEPNDRIIKGNWENEEILTQYELCSKQFWFIKWLVENDKIDLWQKLFNLTKNDNRKSIICDLDNNDFSWEDTFLMLLSISNSPIEDLLLYLK